MRPGRLLPLLALLLAAGCASGGGIIAPGIPLEPLRPEDRVVLGDFTTVRAVAASFDRVYVAYESTLGIWLPLEQRWEVPRRPNNPGLLRDVVAALIDPLDQSVWLATRSGWVRYSLDTDIWERGTLPGTVNAMAIDPNNPVDGIWFRTSAGWFRQDRGGPPVAAVAPRTLRLATTLEDAYRDMPSLRSFGPTMAIGPSLRTGRLTAAAAAANGQGWFIGTSTRGLLFVDRMTVLADPMPLGIGGESVGALALVGDGIWVTTDAGFDGLPAALTYLHENLGTAIRLEGNPAMGLPFSASRRVLPGDRVVWVGSDRGLVRVPIDGDSPELYGEGSGLPIPLVTALIQWREQVVVGTMRGLAIYDSTGLNRTAPGVIDAIRTLATRGDTLWVGGDFGLGAMLIGDTTVRVSTGWRRLTSQRIPVYGIGYVMDTMVVLSQDRVIWRDPSTGAWTPGPLLGTTLGPLHTMFATDAGVWVGGDRGAALVLLNAGPIRTLTVGADLPGAVRAIAANDRYLWIGTIDGLVRLKLR